MKKPKMQVPGLNDDPSEGDLAEQIVCNSLYAHYLWPKFLEKKPSQYAFLVVARFSTAVDVEAWGHLSKETIESIDISDLRDFIIEAPNLRETIAPMLLERPETRVRPEWYLPCIIRHVPKYAEEAQKRLDAVPPPKKKRIEDVLAGK